MRVHLFKLSFIAEFRVFSVRAITCLVIVAFSEIIRYFKIFRFGRQYIMQALFQSFVILRLILNFFTHFLLSLVLSLVDIAPLLGQNLYIFAWINLWENHIFFAELCSHDVQWLIALLLYIAFFLQQFEVLLNFNYKQRLLWLVLRAEQFFLEQRAFGPLRANKFLKVQIHSADQFFIGPLPVVLSIGSYI